MPASNDSKAPGPEAGWFSLLSRRTQALLLALLMLAASAGSFLLSMHEMHAGERLTNMAGRSDWSDGFFFSALMFVLGACLLAVAVGWKPEGSKPEPEDK